MSALEEFFTPAFAALCPSHALVAAISGGIDSMALLELLVSTKHKIVVAHFNHHLRGADSDLDEAFVRDEATRLGLEFRAGGGDVRAAAKGISVEMAARKLRHDFLASIARDFSADLVLAHHADDQIELFLLRLLRGIEGSGLIGMREVSPSPADPNVRMLRPLLNVPKSEINEFAARKKIRAAEKCARSCRARARRIFLAKIFFVCAHYVIDIFFLNVYKSQHVVRLSV